MPTDPEVVKKTITPSGESPANTSPQEAPKVENSQLSPEQLAAGKAEVDKVFQKIVNKNERAERNLEKQREDAIKAENQKFIQEQLEAIAKNPSENKIDFLVEVGELPQDKDLQLIVVNISKTLLNNEGLLETDTAVPVMDQWMRMLTAAGKDKPDDVRLEILRFKKRLAKKIVEVANSRGQAEETPDQKEKRSIVRQSSASAWARQLANENADIEETFSLIRKGVGAQGGGNGAPPGGAPPSGGSSGSSSGGGSGSSGGGRSSGGQGSRFSGASGGAAGSAMAATADESWKVFNESDLRFAGFPNDLQNLIKSVNDTAEKSPRALSDHYLEGVVSKLDTLNPRGDPAIREIIREIKESVNAKTENLETTTSQRRFNENTSEQRRRIAERFQMSLEPQRGYEEVGYDRKDVFFIDYILSIPKNAEDFIHGRNFGAMLKTIEDQTEFDSEIPIDELKRQSKKYAGEDFSYMDFGTIDSSADPDYLAKNYEKFKRAVRKVYDHLFDAAARNRLDEFDKNWGQLREAPIANKIESGLQQLARHFGSLSRDPSRNPAVGEVIKLDYEDKFRDPKTGESVVCRPNDVHFNPIIHISEALAIFGQRLGKEKDIRAYNHDVGVVLGKKLNLEQLAGFAQRLDATQVDTIFLEDEWVQTAYHFYIQELYKTSADNFWVMGTTWLSDDPQGKVGVEEKVKDALRDLSGKSEHPLNDRDLNRLVSMASGMAFGITGEGFDILAQNKPPNRDGARGFAGYFASNILPSWNIQHLYERFGIPNHMAELMYLQIFKGGRFGKVWDYRSLEEEMKKRKNILKTGLLWSLTGEPPMIERVSKIFGVKGVLARGGWRIRALTTHHLVPLDPNKPMLKEPYDPNWNTEKAEKWGKDELIWENINWEESFKNLEKAGTGVMLSYWIDQRIANDPKYVERFSHGHGEHGGGHGHGDSPAKEGAYKDYLNKVRTRNPLKFLRFDLSQEFDKSLRYRALKYVDVFSAGQRDYKSVKGLVDETERDLYLVTEQLTRDNKWEVKAENWNKLEEIVGVDRRNRAERYWNGLQVEIAKPDGHGTIGEIYDNFFKDDSKYYFFGSEDINFKELSMREGGFDILKRAYGDINTLSKGVEAFGQFPDVLKASASSKDFGEIIKKIHEICHPIESVYGTAEAEQMAYILVTMSARFFGKSWYTRLPLGFGTVANWLTTASVSEKVFGKDAWSWDENKTAEFIKAVGSHTGLIPTDTKHWFNMKNLAGEVGARNYQALYDILRSAIPLIILLILWQAIQAETKDSGGGGAGGGGGGHH